ncbi:MAG: hypothetical protein IJU16_05840 [Clostridia bacterium]|nr:hypothetical protein [Clostridia bacterium]
MMHRNALLPIKRIAALLLCLALTAALVAPVAAAAEPTTKTRPRRMV